MDARTNTPINPWVQLASLFGSFTVGGFIGLWLASWAAPGSGVAAAISGILLPAAFAGGLMIWAGLDIVVTVVDLIRRRSRPPTSLAPRAGRWFLTLSLLFNVPGGLVVGMLPGGHLPGPHVCAADSIKRSFDHAVAAPMRASGRLMCL